MNTKSKYVKWSKILKEYGVKHSEQDYYNNIDKIKFIGSCVYSTQFLESRYGFLLSEKEIEVLRLSISNKILNKRINSYSLAEVSKKYNISPEEAKKKIDILKSKTCGSIGRYISKYGEIEGTIKYKEFCGRSAITLEKYISKYGEIEGTIKYKEYVSKKTRFGKLENCISEYGKIKGSEKFRERQSKWQTTLKNKSIEEKERINFLKDSSSMRAILRRCGGNQESAKSAYEELCRKKSLTLDKFVEKYGKEEGINRYENRRLSCSCVYKKLKSLYGAHKAKELYKKTDKKELFEKYGNKYLRLPSKKNAGCVSKSSISLFSLIEKSIERKLYFGSKSKEIRIFDIANKRFYYYDCFDEASNTIIEYHGRAWHPKEGDINWMHPYGISYDEVIAKDRRKKQVAIKSGYNFICIYEDDVKLSHLKNDKIKQIVEILNENKKNKI